MRTRVWILVLTVALVGLVGCGPAAQPTSATMRAAELGVSLPAPTGWQVRSGSPEMAFRGDGTGIILEEPLNGRPFDAVATQLAREFGAEVLAIDSLSVAGHPAKMAVIDFPNAGSRALKVYIDRGSILVEVSFVTPAGDFDAEEAAIREAIAGIRFQ